MEHLSPEAVLASEKLRAKDVLQIEFMRRAISEDEGRARDENRPARSKKEVWFGPVIDDPDNLASRFDRWYEARGLNGTPVTPDTAAELWDEFKKTLPL